MKIFAPDLFRKQFPLLIDFQVENQGNKNQVEPLIYFDNAATTQKPDYVIDVVRNYYETSNANVHRASHQLSAKATFAFEQSRRDLQKFINASSVKELIWTKGATESLNIICQSLARNTLKPGDEIVISASEHHANIVPWQIVAQQTGAKIKILPLTASGVIDISHLDKVITEQVKFVACTHISNVLGRINPIKQVINKAKSVGAKSVIDGAQAVAHIDVDVQQLGCDFYVFSAHKMYGPTGIGVLYGKIQHLENMAPYQAGGEMIKTVSFKQATTYNSLPFKFEAGTPNIAGVVGFGACINFLSPFLQDNAKGYHDYESKLTQYCYEKLAAIPAINFLVEGVPDIGVIAFTVLGHHNHDIATALDSKGIAVRSGHHCAMPLMETLQIDGCLRISLSPYNSFKEVDYLIHCLNKILLTTDEDKPSEALFLASDTPSSISEEDIQQKKIIARFTKTKGWDSLHREIMLLGKELPRLDKSERNDDTLISGCESKAWLKVSQDKQGIFSFSADSDAKVIRGLLVIVLAAFNHKSSEQIMKFDIDLYLKKLGLLAHLSPSRGNGLLAIVDKIKTLAQS
ncbi:SufS family cysteine desulfurase [Colwelliaceae bacterium MEBiC 14330]